MNVLLLGSGAREHALAWKLAQSPLLETLYCAPGNPGTARVGKNVALDVLSHESVIAFAKEHEIGLVVVGPDDLLAAGIVDALTHAGIPTFGPTQAAAEIEWSKAYAKEVMEAAYIPTAKSETFADEASALAYLEAQGVPIVVKASGLALGKGVTVAQSKEEAQEAVRECFAGKFGEAGKSVVIEEYLEGFEFSVHALCAGTEVLMFPSSMDHKRIGEGDVGANTGGMGTIAPVPGIGDEVMEDIRVRIVVPLLEELSKRGRPFSGLLFPGIMLTSDGPRVLEFNARFGDPETESYMRLLESDLLPVLLACAQGSLGGVLLAWKKETAVCVMLASRGYPGSYEKGKEITGITAEEPVVVFHAGTKEDGEKLLTNGGRVLGVSALEATLTDARTAAYEAVRQISFEGIQYRGDIGRRALARMDTVGDT